GLDRRSGHGLRGERRGARSRSRRRRRRAGRPPAGRPRSGRAGRCGAGRRARLAGAPRPPPAGRHAHLRRARAPRLVRRRPPGDRGCRPPIRRGRPMTDAPDRIVDAHVHLWDPARTDWYPYLTRSGPEPSGGASGMYRRFDVDTYRAETAGWNVEKFVNVAAATGRHSVEETIELDARAGARGGPQAIIGGLPPTETVTEAVELLDRQMAAPRLRGVRPMGPLGQPVPDPAVLRALQERSLVFELMTHPDQLRAAAGRLAGFDDLVVVVEHTGWPRSDSADERALWQSGIDALADLGENVACKLSGLAMPFGTMRADR